MSFEELKQKDQKFIANTYSRFPTDLCSRFPTDLCRGEGATLWSESGKKYVDFGSGIAVNSFGVNDEEWKSAVIAQLNKVQHASNLYYTRPQAELAEMLCSRTGAKKVFFSNSGAEANECAIKAARKYSFDKYGEGRFRIVTLKNSFHGRTMATLSATGQEAMHRCFAPMLGGFDYADPTFESVRAKCTKATCAVMLELVQGEGGVRPLPVEEVHCMPLSSSAFRPTSCRRRRGLQAVCLSGRRCSLIRRKRFLPRATTARPSAAIPSPARAHAVFFRASIKIFCSRCRARAPICLRIWVASKM